MSMPIAREVWFLTGSQGLYGEETLRQVAEQSQRIAAGTRRRRRASRSGWCGSRCSPTPTRSAGLCLDANADDRCIGVIAWMHTFSPAKMWIAGLDALGKPLLHLHTQANVALPWATIDMDFMNLNQAAHGDREFGYIQTRLGVARKTVAGHVSDPGVTRARIATWARAAVGLRGAAYAAAGPVRRQHARRRGDRGRQGRGAAHASASSVNTYGVNDLVAAVDASDAGASRRAGHGVRGHLQRRRRAAAGRRRGTSRCATPRGSSSGCATS